MTQLSPAALAVMQAFTRGNTLLIEDGVCRSVCADALRAAAGQIQQNSSHGSGAFSGGFNEGIKVAADDILALAAELDGGVP